MPCAKCNISVRRLQINVIQSFLNRSSDCPPESMNTRNCSLYGWEADAQCVFSGVNITNITLSSTASLDYDIDGSKINITLAYVHYGHYVYQIGWFAGLEK